MDDAQAQQDNEEDGNNIKDFDAKLKLIEEWLEKPKYVVDCTKDVVAKNKK